MHHGQERFDLLLKWCQLIGLAPFRMERDAESGRFLRFRFSWRHPLTYWWLGGKAVYAAGFTFSKLHRWIFMEQKPVAREIAATEILVSAVGNTLSIVTFFCAPETLVLCVAHFSKASRYLNEFDAMLENRRVPACSTPKFTVIGIVSTLFLVLLIIKKWQVDS